MIRRLGGRLPDRWPLFGNAVNFKHVQFPKNRRLGRDCGPTKLTDGRSLPADMSAAIGRDFGTSAWAALGSDYTTSLDREQRPSVPASQFLGGAMRG